MTTTRFAVLGVGEAGFALANDLLLLGHEVTAFDPNPRRTPSGVELTTSAAEAVARADVVLSVNTAAVSESVASSVLPSLVADQIYADLNTSEPSRKRRIAEIIGPTGALFVDVALVAPVPNLGIRTPSLASGVGASRFQDLLTPLGMPVEVVEGGAGVAATHKLLRSVLMKGVAATVLESLEAATKAGLRPWLEPQVRNLFANPALLDRLEEGTRKHAARRVHEMEAAADLLRELNATHYTTEATLALLRDLARWEGPPEKVRPGGNSVTSEKERR